MIDDVREDIQTFLNGEREGVVVAADVLGNLGTKKTFKHFKSKIGKKILKPLKKV